MTARPLDDELIQNGYAPLTLADVATYEAELGFPLPIEYRDFLLWQNGGECPSYVVAGSSDVSAFYALQHDFYRADLIWVRGGWSNILPDEFLAFATSACGDYYCIHRKSGRIYFLYHDDPFQNFASLKPIAKTLSQFLHSLRRELPDFYSAESLPEFQAVLAGDRPQLRGLLQTQSHLNLKNADGTLLLQYAIGLWRRGMVSDLIEAGADIEALGPKGETALFRAGSAQVVDIGILLLRAGANPNAVDATGMSVLMHTIGRGNVRLAVEIIKAGAIINYHAPDGRTALDCCVTGPTNEYVAPALRAASRLK